ncbi:MAG: 16S rRNA (guanine(966)-N(2))-methyltransferase RsmD [Selenomonadaceae bacterium]|nr:16S rRNA (guanine(966)-N(2))-methyltransferase RsmD [Selenomonadaceae bacterium]
MKLKTPAGLSTRPTSDRVKESLFSILNGLIDFSEIKSVLDIFAGTGALGLESVSRGANSATFIDAATAEIIRENINRAKFENCKVLRGDFEKILSKLAKDNRTFDLIFSDPPYAKGLSQKSLNLVAELKLLSDGGLMIIEHGAEEILDVPTSFNSIRKITYGHTTAITILVKSFELRALSFKDFSKS